MMMKYSIHKAVVMMMANIKLYFWIVVELTLIAGVLVLADATHRSADREIERLSDIYQEQDIYITWYSLEEGFGIEGRAAAGITLQDFMFLQERYPANVTFEYHVYDRIGLYADGVFGDIFLVWGSEQFFEKQFGKEFLHFDDLAGYIGPGAGALLSDRNAMIISGSGMGISRGAHPNSLMINDAEYLFKPLDVSNMIPGSSAGFEIDSSECLFLPIEERPEDWGQTNVSTTLSVSFDDFRKAPELIQEMISLLIDRHEGKFKYQYSNVLDDYISRAESILDEIDLFSFIAKVCLCVAVFGITGIMTILIRKRRKAYAISYAMGAHKWNICMELLFEVFMVCGAGSVLGCLLGFLLTCWQTQSAFWVHFSPACVSVPALIALLIPLLTGVVILPDVNAVNPVETMKSE